MEWGGELILFKNYWSNRRQYVELNGCKSTLGTVERGVPQGSVLSPQLFTIYVNDIINLDLHGKIYMYADDICVLYPYKNEIALKAYMETD